MKVDAISGKKSILAKPAIRPFFLIPVTYDQNTGVLYSFGQQNCINKNVRELMSINLQVSCGFEGIPQQGYLRTFDMMFIKRYVVLVFSKQK